ncbi:hypothetical protein CupriaWKF_09820 [Cupriavidus sp. WKF15]|uniref:hypothetical protein n=1 Tax=Cupriavidus sp. WKF15 TaxID=3032282 RepID=UPI0023E228D3|nr:hypothetical protein [Cupriavidus sp. WKF15]WER44645.1 hypothetical protein CupriaWKF_09820 [Cupriavidus sp. WKF15]
MTTEEACTTIRKVHGLPTAAGASSHEGRANQMRCYPSLSKFWKYCDWSDNGGITAPLSAGASHKHALGFGDVEHCSGQADVVANQSAPLENIANPLPFSRHCRAYRYASHHGTPYKFANCTSP